SSTTAIPGVLTLTVGPCGTSRGPVWMVEATRRTRKAATKVAPTPSSARKRLLTRDQLRRFAGAACPIAIPPLCASAPHPRSLPNQRRSSNEGNGVVFFGTEEDDILAASTDSDPVTPS